MNSVDVKQFSTGCHVNRQREEQLPVLQIGCLSGIQQVFPYTLRAGGGKRQVGVNLWGDSPVYMNSVSDLYH
jgi:hypothetical protein